MHCHRIFMVTAIGRSRRWSVRRAARVLGGCLLGLMIWMSLPAPALARNAAIHGFPDGGRDAVLIATPDGAVAYSANAETPLVPASVFKLLTALVAIDTLGADYRFPTDFSTTPDNRLVVKGYGDPLLVSEVLDECAAQLASRLPPARRPCLSGILLDNRYFSEPLVIPGVSDSANPYDAPNGALCANFNTVFFSRDPRTGRFVSAEPQTPLLAFSRDLIAGHTATTDRVVLSHRGDVATLYVGHLLRYFMTSHGCRITGDITVMPATEPGAGGFSWRFSSPFTLTDVIGKMMAYSNNFIANQLFIASAAAAYGPPGSLASGARLSRRFAADRLGLHQVAITEGAGISRENRISAADMHRVLKAFYPYRGLLRHADDDAFKTGTLDGIRSRVGYITAAGGDYGYVVILNGRPGDMDAVMRAVRQRIMDMAGARAQP